MTEWTLAQMRRMSELLGRTTPAVHLLDVAELAYKFARENGAAAVTPAPAPASAVLEAAPAALRGATPTHVLIDEVEDGPAAVADTVADPEPPSPPAAPAAATPAKKPAAPRAPAAAPKLPVGAAWTDEDIATLRRMRAEGYTASAIGQHLGRTTRAIENALRRLLTQTLGQPRQTSQDAPAPAAAVTAPPAPRPTPAPAVQTAPPAAVSPAPGRSVPGLVRAILQHLGSLDQESFTPADDLLIGQMVVGRQGFDIIAGHLGCEPNAAKNRWEALRRLRAITTERGHLTIDGQTALLRALAIRAEDVADVA